MYRLQAAHERKYNDDQERHPEEAGRAISPAARMRPGRHGADQKNNQDYDDES